MDRPPCDLAGGGAIAIEALAVVGGVVANLGVRLLVSLANCWPPLDEFVGAQGAVEVEVGVLLADLPFLATGAQPLPIALDFDWAEDMVHCFLCEVNFVRA